MKIIKYGKPGCKPCKIMSETLKRAGYEYQEIELTEECAKNYKTLPHMEFYNDEGLLVFIFAGTLTLDELDDIVEKYDR